MKRAAAAPARFDDADALDDDAMALMMERVEKENGGGDAAGAADRAKREREKTGGSGWVPATFSRAPSAAAGKTEPRAAEPARTSLPANVFARAAPAKKSAELSRLAGLFKRVEEKKHARAVDSPPAPKAPKAAARTAGGARGGGAARGECPSRPNGRVRQAQGGVLRGREQETQARVMFRSVSVPGRRSRMSRRGTSRQSERRETSRVP